MLKLLNISNSNTLYLTSSFESRIDMLQEICSQQINCQLNGIILAGNWTLNGKNVKFCY